MDRLDLSRTCEFSILVLQVVLPRGLQFIQFILLGPLGRASSFRLHFEDGHSCKPWTVMHDMLCRAVQEARRAEDNQDPNALHSGIAKVFVSMSLPIRALSSKKQIDLQGEYEKSSEKGSEA